MTAATPPPFRVLLEEHPERGVRVWSSYQVQIERSAARPWRAKLLERLRDHLTHLDVGAGQGLAGTYLTTDPQPCDAQNRLFTNTSSALPPVTRLRFELCSGPPPAPPEPLEPSQHLHYYEYRAEPADPELPPWRCWSPGRVLARWQDVAQPLVALGDSARPWWIAMRRPAENGQVELLGDAASMPPGSPFGVRLTVYTGRTGPTSLKAIHEQAVDGALAAFHAGTPDPQRIRMLARRTGAALAEEAARFAASDGPGPLFPTPMVTTHGALSPDDTRCWAGEVRLRPTGTSSGATQISGEVFRLEPAVRQPDEERR